MKINFKFLSVFGFLLILQLPISGTAQQKTDKVQLFSTFVDPFIGTMEMGHTFPGACVPFGMVQLSPETDTIPYSENGRYNPKVYRYCSGYQYADKTIVGFSHTHMSGTGHSDLGDFLIMATTGKLKLNPGTASNPEDGFRSPYDHSEEYAEPGYYSVVLKKYKVLAELTVSARAGFHQYTFPKTDSAHIILDMNYGIYNYDGKVLWSYIRVENDTLITGYRITQGWARTRYIYFAMTFSKPFKSYGYKNFKEPLYKGFWRKFNQYENFPEMAGTDIKAYFNFSTSDKEKIKIKLAISSVSTEGALQNLKTEIPHWNFEKTRAEAFSLWENELNKINIIAPDSIKTVFYTSFYHSLIHPIIFNDVDGKYRGLDGNIHRVTNRNNYTLFSLWDTYRALHPLFTILDPERVADMIQSMIDHYSQSVHQLLPVWSHYGNENWCMIGYHSVPVIVDAYMKGIRNFDISKAFEACTSTATHQDFQGIGDYMKYGYVPFDKLGNSASVTLEYAYDDFTIAQFANELDKQDDYRIFLKRALSYQNIFDPSTLFIRARDSEGRWKSPCDPLSTEGQGFIEGNAWNYSLYVPQDINGFMKMLGGEKALIQRLDSLFTMHLDDKYFENTEDVTRAGMIGNYVHGNEPSHHVPYMYIWTSQPWKTQEKVHLIMNTMYTTATDGLCGNDDCGQMSAWYIFSALGFYPVCPGTNQYVFGSPLVSEAKIRLNNNKIFTIKAIKLNKNNIYIQSVSLNGKPYQKTYITHQDLMNGGELIFKMGDKPNKKWGLAKENKPFSISGGL